MEIIPLKYSKLLQNSLPILLLLVFDPNLQLDENNPDIKQIHEDYKNLVDYMLGSFMEEMQITPEQFEMACMEGKQQHKDNPFQFHQGLFQQVWKRLTNIEKITKRNILYSFRYGQLMI